MTENIMGVSDTGGDKPSGWTNDDDRAVKKLLWDVKKRTSHAGPLESWPLHDDYLSKAVELRILAKQIAATASEPLNRAWGTIKKRIFQEKGGVIDGLFLLSDYHRRMMRRAFAIAGDLHPDSRSKQVEEAERIFLGEAQQRTVDAWHADQYEQLSLFDDVSKHEGPDSKTRLDVVPDQTTTGANPGDTQLSFLWAVLQESDLDERTLDVAELLSDGLSEAAVARHLGVSKQTVMRSKNKILEFHQGWLIEGEPNAD